MRTKNSFYNFLVSIISGFIIPILGFAKVRLFIDLYGSDINGLYLVFINIINYINISEHAFSLAFRQLLYKPLADNDRSLLNKIFSGVRSIYQKIGVLMIVVGFVVALIMPIFIESSLPSGVIIGLFLVLSLPFGLSYFILPPSLLIIADQKEYRISIWIQLVAIIRMILMIIVIMLKLPYVIIFVIEGLNVIIGNFVAYKIAIKNYPWLKVDKSIKSNADFMKNAKHTLIQRLAFLAINNTDSIIISRFINLTAVSVYGAYNYLIEATLRIVHSAITSPINSFGNLFNSDNEKSYQVFKEYYEFTLFFASVLSICIFVVLDQFVYIWMHQQSYILPLSISVIFALNVFYLTQREAIIIIRDANRLFIDAKKNAYLMTLFKVLGSLLLVKVLGITGILLATLMTYYFVDLTYNPKLVFEKVFKVNPIEYYRVFFVRLVLAVFLSYAFYILYRSQAVFVTSSLLHFVISLVILGGSVVLILFIVYYAMFSSFRDLVKRGLNLLRLR